ncbi:MAG: AAA family ATPase, partial [Planctomycetota bacterium]|nr:AAA family ATPase [Planctomycetota bacterium]
MRLKRLELFGFKSFADRTVLEFGENSLTGIVGPNGCGKSNVVDAIRWVLGETRPTSMRGAEMSDVIFKGSASRPALSVAEVSLVIDNDAGLLEGCGSEVSITRRVFKTGEGEYLIDGDRVRLKDVRNLLFDTGLGSRGYSVLEQGRIDAILSANPLQRRSIFEEAAGISRYRQRRHETELRMARVLQDTARLEDVLGELRTRVRSLKIQAGKAERFVTARDAYRTHKTRLFQHRVHQLEKELARTAPALGVLEQQTADLRAERTRFEADASGREEERDRLLAEIERLSSEAARLEGECRAVDERRSQTTARVATWRAGAQEDRAREAELLTQAQERGEVLADLRAECAELDGGLGERQERVGELTGGVTAAVKEYRDARRRAEEQNEKVLGLLHRKTETGNTLRHLDEALEPARERHGRLATRSAECGERVGELAASGDLADRELASARGTLESAIGQRSELESSLSEVEESLGVEGAQLAELELEEARLSSHRDSLLERERNTADLATGSRCLLEAEEAGCGPRLGAALAGLLADHITSRTEDARALDAVLGARAESVVVADAAAARAVSRWLLEGPEAADDAGAGAASSGSLPADTTRTRRGQAALTVLAGLGQRRGRRADLVSGAGIMGPLADRVTAASDYAPLVEFLCGDVWLVEDLETALACVAAQPELRFVTVAGELVDAGGLTVGSTEITSGAVGRRARASELGERLEALGVELSQLRETLAALELRRAEQRAALEESSADVEQARSALGQAESVAAAAQARRAELEAASEAAAAEAREAREAFEKLERDLIVAEEERLRAEEDFTRENGSLGELEQERHGLEDERDRLSAEESRARVSLAQAREQREGLMRRVSDLEHGLEEARAEMGRARERAEGQSRSASNGEEEIKQLGGDGARLLEERGV